MSAWRFERPAELPLPEPSEEAKPFFEALKEGELRVPKCAKCGRLSYPPRAMCPDCQSFEFEWARLSGRGTVYSYVVRDHASHRISWMCHRMQSRLAWRWRWCSRRSATR